MNDLRLHGMQAETLRYLDGLGFLGWQLGLERITRLCDFLGNPQTHYPSVHIAGTNGKGSTAAMLATIAQAAGLRVGLYTSPHLVHPRERLQINGAPISGEDLERAVQSCRGVIDDLRATYFEALTAIALQWFDQQRVDLAVIETGLGGRLDATNVIMPEATIITSIGLEHQQYLGRTLARIAREKAGIIKAGRPCVSGVKPAAARAVIAEVCQAQATPFIDIHSATHRSRVRLAETGTQFRLRAERLEHAFEQDYQLNLLGAHQVENAVLAICAAQLLRERGFPINATSCTAGLSRVRWPGRMQLLEASPQILIDAAHNAEGMRKLVRSIRAIFPERRVKVVLSLLKDKALTQVLRAWRDLPVEFFFAPAQSDRARAPERMQAEAQRMGFTAHARGSARAAVAAAQASCKDDDLLCVAGSHYLIGELMEDGVLPYPY